MPFILPNNLLPSQPMSNQLRSMDASCLLISTILFTTVLVSTIAIATAIIISAVAIPIIAAIILPFAAIGDTIILIAAAVFPIVIAALTAIVNIIVAHAFIDAPIHVPIVATISRTLDRIRLIVHVADVFATIVQAIINAIAILAAIIVTHGIHDTAILRTLITVGGLKAYLGTVLVTILVCTGVAAPFSVPVTPRRAFRLAVRTEVIATTIIGVVGVSLIASGTRLPRLALALPVLFLLSTVGVVFRPPFIALFLPFLGCVSLELGDLIRGHVGGEEVG